MSTNDSYAVLLNERDYYRNKCLELAAHVEAAAGIMHRLAESPAHIDGEAPPAVRAYLDWYSSRPCRRPREE